MSFLTRISLALLRRLIRPSKPRPIRRRARLGEDIYLPDRCVPAVISWTGANSSDYFDPGDWQGNTVPGVNDTAYFGSAARRGVEVNKNTTVGGWQFASGFGFNAVIDAGVTVKAGTSILSGGTLDGAGTFEVTNSLSWNILMKGSGRTLIDANATASFLGTGPAVDTRKLEVIGTANVATTIQNGASIVVDASGTANVGPLTMTNGCTLSVSVGGDINVSGNISDGGGNPSSIVNNGGTFTVLASNGNTYTIAEPLTAGGVGMTQADILVGANTTAVFTQKVVFNKLAMVDGDGAFAFRGELDWNNGASIKDSNIAGLGRTQLFGNTYISGNVQLSLRPIDNYGTVYWTDYDPNNPSQLDLADTAKLTNYSTFTMQGNVALVSSGAGLGVLWNKSGATMTVDTLGLPFYPPGNLDIANTAVFNNDGQFKLINANAAIHGSGTSNGGQFFVPTGDTLTFDAQNNPGVVYTLQPAAGGGSLIFGPGQVVVKEKMNLAVNNQPLQIASLQLQDVGSQISGNGMVSVTSTLNWYDGDMTGTGTTVLTTTATGTLFNAAPNGRNLNTRNLVIQGILTWAAGDVYVVNGSTITLDGQNNPGRGILDVQSDNSIFDPNAGKMGAAGPIIITNQGLLKKSLSPGGQATVIQPLVDDAGGKVDAMGNKITYSKVKVEVGGIFDLSGGVATVSDTFEQDGGTTSLGGGTLNAATVLLNAGMLTLDAGILSATNGVQIGRSAGLSGSGSIVGDVTNAGFINVGGPNAVGLVSITGNYTQTSTGVLNLEIAGSASNQYDALVISGSANLGGTLYVSLLNGFTPTPGQVYELLSYGSRVSGSQFANVYYPGFSGGHFSPQYDNPPDTFSLWVLQ